MAGKLTPARRIDAKAALDGGETFDVSAEDFAPPAGRTIEGPENLALDSALVRSAITPEASISATWEVLVGVVPDQFIVQISTDNTFPDNNTRTLFTPGDQLSIMIAALKTATTYSVRVALVRQAAQSAWSEAVAETTPNDTTAPGPPTGATYDWSGANLLLTWTDPTSDNFERTQIDIYASNGGALLHTFYSSIAHFTYLATQNLADTGGAGDPSLYVVLTSRSHANIPCIAPVNLSPTNAAPSAPTVSAAVGFTQILATVTSAPPLDLDVYEFVWKNGAGSTVRTTYTQAATDLYQATTTDTYSVVVRVRDIFGQYSSTTTVGTLVVDALTITDLRSDSSYSDSIGTDFSSAPNKTVLKDDAVGAGISYASSASAWRWTKVAYPLTDRFRRISLKLGSGAANFYVGLSSDDVTYTWYSGALTGFVLTLVASEAAAQAAAPLFSALPDGYAELPATTEARFIKVGHRNTTTGYRIDEAYGQRIVIVDVIKVSQLSAITANMGTVTAGTIDGATVYAGTAHDVRLDNTGITVTVPVSAPADIDSYKLARGDGTVLGGLYGYYITGGAAQHYVIAKAVSVAGEPSTFEIDAITPSGFSSLITLHAQRATAADASIDILNSSAGSRQISISGDVFMDAGLNVGSATGAATGAVWIGATSPALDWKGSAQQWRALLDHTTSDRWALYDVTNNRTPLIVEAGAASNSVKINSSGALLLGSMTAKSVPFIGASGVVSQDNSNFWWDDTDNVLHLGGTSTITGSPRLALKGTDGSATAGPHLHAYTAADIYPLFQLLSYTHDNISLVFDAYLDTAAVWKSSDAGSNFRVAKGGDTLALSYSAGVAQGSNITWNSGLILDSAGGITVNNGLNVGAASGATAGMVKASGVFQPSSVAVSYAANNLTIANNGVAALGMSNFGFAFLHAGGSGPATFAINGGLHTTQELQDVGGVYSVTAGTAASINIYWSAGNSRYEIENKRGSSITVRIWLLDAA